MYQKFAMLAAVLLLLLTACQAKPKPAESSPVPLKSDPFSKTAKRSPRRGRFFCAAIYFA